jgi:hypothetical protein
MRARRGSDKAATLLTWSAPQPLRCWRREIPYGAATFKASEGGNTAFRRVHNFMCAGDFWIAGSLLEPNRCVGYSSAVVGRTEQAMIDWLLGTPIVAILLIVVAFHFVFYLFLAFLDEEQRNV